MIKRAAWFAIILLTFGTHAFAGQVSGVSNTFEIDNTKGGPPDIPSYCGSPYGAGTVLLRGQLHAHRMSDWSSHSISSGSLAESYINQGYDFLAQTEHHFKPDYRFEGVSPEFVLGSWQGWAPNSTELTYGSLTAWPGLDTHVLAVGTSQGTTALDLHYHTGNTVNDTIQRVKNVHNHSGLAYVAHPDSRPYNIGADDLVQVYRGSGMDGIGVYTPPHGSSQRTWDRLVYALGRPVWGYVEDDYHPDFMSKGNLGRTWVAVPGSPGEWWGNIREKLRNGNYYCYYTTSGKWPGGSTSPQMRVTVSNSGSQPLISVDFDRVVNSIEFYGYDWGFFKKLKSPVSGSSDSYQATGREKFVRVMAHYEFSGGTLWMTSQPIVINKNGNYSPYYLNGVSLMSMSPELILSYIDANYKPLAPTTGYVGDAFDVTTTDGQLPPGATLQLSYAEEDIGPLGGTQYLAIYRYNDAVQQWVKIGGTVDPGTQTIESPITALGKYCISADLPEDTAVPEVFIDNPPYAASVAVDTTVRATVNDDIGAWRVKFYMNDHLLAEDAYGDDGWSADIKITDYCAGDRILKAEAEDLVGNAGIVEMPIHIASSTPPPTLTVDSPAVGSVLTGVVTASGTCGDDVAVANMILRLEDTVVGFADIDGGNWTCQIDTSYLVDGNRTLTATVEDYPGNTASVSVPVVINSGQTSSSPGSAKTLPDGASIRTGDCVVVALPALTGDGYYVESTDRSSGIRIRTAKVLSLGDKISMIGTVSAPSGAERVVEVSDAVVLSSGNVIKPLGISASRVSLNPDSIGKVMKMWGSVGEVDTSVPAKWFILKDPSGVDVKCVLGDDVTAPSSGSIVVTGVCSIDAQTGQALMLITSPSDVRTLP